MINSAISNFWNTVAFCVFFLLLGVVHDASRGMACLCDNGGVGQTIRMHYGVIENHDGGSTNDEEDRKMILVQELIVAKPNNRPTGSNRLELVARKFGRHKFEADHHGS